MNIRYVKTVPYDGDEHENLNVILDKFDDSLWLSQKTLTELFDVDKKTLKKHVDQLHGKNSELSDDIDLEFQIYEFDTAVNLAFAISTPNALNSENGLQTI